jgi:hypothetical protein
LRIQIIGLHLLINQSHIFYLLTKSNTMTTLTNIEVLRMKRAAAVTKMDNSLKCINLRKDFFIACKEIRAIDEQIKQINTSK